MLVAYDESLTRHLAGVSHAEHGERVHAAAQELSRRGLLGERIDTRPATREEVARVHDPHYIDLVQSECERLGRDESGAWRVNDYPAYYRCNTPGAVLAAITGLGFRSATFFHYPCVQWDTYFPTWLRWVPRAWDLALATRFTNHMQILIIKLDKGDGQG